MLTTQPDLAALHATYTARATIRPTSSSSPFSEQLDPTADAMSSPRGRPRTQLVQQMATAMGFRNVHFSPRGGALGWAMPLAVGLSLGTGQPAVCFVGDGGSLFSVHAIWTAAALKLPVVFVCFVNHEYRLLKDLWVSFTGGTFDTTRFVGLDFDDPALDSTPSCAGSAQSPSPRSNDEVAYAMAQPESARTDRLLVERRP